MIWPNTLIEKLGVKYPIIQAPMFGVSTPQMVAASAKAGCLGTLALADLSAAQSAQLIQETKRLTDQAFAVNIFAHHIPEITDDLRQKFVKTKRFIEELAKENHLEINLPDLEHIKVNSYHEQVDVIIEHGCKIVSFTFGNLDAESIRKLKEHNITLIGSCTSVEEALMLEESGIDIICVQGIEAGGHRGTFDPENIPEIGGFSLLSQVFDSVKVPLLYAGGIYNARTLWASKELGAQGFQVGSILLASQESALQPFEKERLQRVTENEVVLTRSFSGRFARGIRNQFTKALDETDYILPYPYQNKLTGELRKVAKAMNNADFVNIWVGQSIHTYSESSATDILKELILEVEKIF
ncbi:tungsten formylmethanofuran dehydrogenase [Chryseobacterium sp. T16E-39]|uniref:NAD(P)H-dependent flavin oxidoreductase n=1 Tax=Chryseobacterium sp. T16E-39 TaxID=2015076 RepID=UPI000B5B20F1|nr:nitronate monooxygenase [Chryseobacterium sp. T16E-39]ASK32116.1 tungsten formylmethanofuran dehydrogenase [Chryseobacterium sp. T16E-39]